jgi:two-component system chemotaxis response regulator CheY
MLTIGDNVMEDIYDLIDFEEIWEHSLYEMEHSNFQEHIEILANEAINKYAGVLNKMYEFITLGYALFSLATFLKSVKDINEKTKPQLILLLKSLLEDLVSWRKTVFEEKNTENIHYLDSSLFSSCMQIETLITGQDMDTGDDNDLELF